MLNAHSEDALVELKLLGDFSLLISGKEIEKALIPGKKTCLLLKILALEKNNEIIKDQVIELLWPQLDLKSGSAQLYKAIYHLRHLFACVLPGTEAEAWLRIKGEFVSLTPPGGLVTDIAAFKKAAWSGLKTKNIHELSKAVSLYKGDLLPMDMYTQWTESPRYELRQLYFDVLLCLSVQYQSKGDLESAMETINIALSKDNTFEEGHRELIRLYALKGQQNRAIQQFNVCSDILLRELSVSPSKETITLIEDIRKQKFPILQAESSLKLTESKADFKLIGREQESLKIQKRLNLIKSAAGCMIVIEGAAGIGKTRLVEEIIFQSNLRGFQSFTGRAYEIEGPIPYGPIIDIIKLMLEENTAAADLIPEEIARYIPSFPEEVKTVSCDDPYAARSYFFVKLFQFFKKRSQTSPLVLVIEDIHEADEETLVFIHYMARNITKEHIMLALTYRVDKKAVQQRIQKYYMNIPIPVEVLILQALTLEEHWDLLHHLSHTDKINFNLNQFIYQMTEGNPLFTIDLFKHPQNDKSFAHLINTGR